MFASRVFVVILILCDKKMPYPGIAVFFIGAGIAAVLYYMFASNQEEEEQQQQSGQYSAGYGRNSSDCQPSNKWNNNSHRRRGTYTTLNEAAECSICLDTSKDDKTTVLPNCKHVFHQKCIKKWESRAIEKVCPNCRHTM